jgi:hypothetical protein
MMFLEYPPYNQVLVTQKQKIIFRDTVFLFLLLEEVSLSKFTLLSYQVISRFLGDRREKSKSQMKQQVTTLCS